MAECTNKQEIASAASIRLMSALPDQPERLVEILREIIALSKTDTNHRESAKRADSTESFDAQCLNGIYQTSAARGKEAG